MKNKNLLYLLIIVIAIALYMVFTNDKDENPKNKPIVNEYLQKYSGGYMIQIEGQIQGNSTEMYVLHSSGKAEWKFIEVVSGNANILSEKSGTWDANENSITIKINGNTGIIEEKYFLLNGKFKSDGRVLLKTN